MLGMERENDLRLRGHAVSLDGRKGNSYLGTQYLLFNSEFDKRILRQPFLELFLGPLLDVGKTYDKPGRFAAPEWLWDIGVQTKVRLRTGASVVFSYGKDLQAGQNVFFLEFSR